METDYSIQQETNDDGGYLHWSKDQANFFEYSQFGGVEVEDNEEDGPTAEHESDGDVGEGQRQSGVLTVANSPLEFKDQRPEEREVEEEEMD